MSHVRQGNAAIDALLIVIAIASGVLIVGLTRQVRTEQNPESIQIRFAEQSPPVLAGQEQAVKLILSNNFQATAADIRLAKACTCSGVMIVVPPGLVLKPGKSVELDASVHPSLDQASILLEYVVHATVDGEQFSINHNVHIPVESPFEGWPEIVEGNLITDARHTVLRIGPVNPLYFAEEKPKAGLSSADYRREVRNSDLDAVPATLTADRSGLWIEIPVQSDVDQYEDYMLMVSSETDQPNRYRIFVPVAISSLKKTIP